MKPERPPRAAGYAANHCDALFRRRDEEVDPLPGLAGLGERLVRELGPALAVLGGGKPPEVRAVGVQRMSATGLGETAHPPRCSQRHSDADARDPWTFVDQIDHRAQAGDRLGVGQDDRLQPQEAEQQSLRVACDEIDPGPVSIGWGGRAHAISAAPSP